MYLSLRFLWLRPDTELGFRGEEPICDEGGEECGSGDGGGGDARRFPFPFNVEGETSSDASDSESDLSEPLEDGV